MAPRRETGEPLEKERKQTRLHLHLKKWLEKAMGDYAMVEKNDRILVGVSGGTDSLALLHLLGTPMVFTPPFTLVAAYIDPGFDGIGADRAVVEAHLQATGVAYVTETSDIGSLAHSPVNRKNPCFLCSRLRRRRLFEIAAAQNCNKIALGHHRDDIVETLLINLFYGREISTMVPRQPLFGGRLSLIRPLAYVREELLKRYAREQAFPILPERCPTAATSYRRRVKALLADLEAGHPGVRENVCRALGNVKLAYLPRQQGQEGAWGRACP